MRGNVAPAPTALGWVCTWRQPWGLLHLRIDIHGTGIFPLAWL